MPNAKTETLAAQVFKKSRARIVLLVVIRTGSPEMVICEDFSVIGREYYRKRLASYLRELAAKVEADNSTKGK